VPVNSTVEFADMVKRVSTTSASANLKPANNSDITAARLTMDAKVESLVASVRMENHVVSNWEVSANHRIIMPLTRSTPGGS
jgi:hypothetical protein